MSFDKLMAELAQATTDQETLSKALPADDGKDDDKIQAAADDGANADADDKSGDGGSAKDKDDKPMAKSFEVTMPDGTKVQAEDGTELVKSLTARLDKSEGEMVKALHGVLSLVKGQAEMIKSQGDLINSLNERLGKVAGEGRGRKAVVTVTEKKDAAEPLAKSGAMNADEFMAKANSAFGSGKITGKELTVIDVSLRQGAAIDGALIQKVVA